MKKTFLFNIFIIIILGVLTTQCGLFNSNDDENSAFGIWTDAAYRLDISSDRFIVYENNNFSDGCWQEYLNTAIESISGNTFVISNYRDPFSSNKFEALIEGGGARLRLEFDDGNTEGAFVEMEDNWEFDICE